MDNVLRRTALLLVAAALVVVIAIAFGLTGERDEHGEHGDADHYGAVHRSAGVLALPLAPPHEAVDEVVSRALAEAFPG